MAAKKAASKKKAAAKKTPARKTAAKKTAAKKTAAKKTTAKKAAAKKPAAKRGAVAKPAAKKAASRYKAGDKAPSKTEILNQIAESTGLARKEVASVFESLEEMISANLSKRGPQTFTVPGLMKMTVKHKPARRAKKGINPFTGEEMMFKAKPASRQVKVLPLKKLKDMVA